MTSKASSLYYASTQCPQRLLLPGAPRAALLSLGLIDEFLHFHGYASTLSVASSEVTGWNARHGASDVRAAMRLPNDDAAGSPLLILLVEAYERLLASDWSWHKPGKHISLLK